MSGAFQEKFTVPFQKDWASAVSLIRCSGQDDEGATRLRSIVNLFLHGCQGMLSEGRVIAGCVIHPIQLEISRSIIVEYFVVFLHPFDFRLSQSGIGWEKGLEAFIFGKLATLVDCTEMFQLILKGQWIQHGRTDAKTNIITKKHHKNSSLNLFPANGRRKKEVYKSTVTIITHSKK